MKPFVSIILPNYNEYQNLKRGVLDSIAQHVANKEYTSEVIISDDGSTDGSLDFIETFMLSHPKFLLLKNKHAGKPFALRSAVKKAKGRYVLFTDMDQSTPIAELDKLLPYVKRGSHIVIGSRGARRVDSTPIRKLASLIFLLARRAILLPRIKDTQCGFKLFETTLALDIFKHMRIFGRNNNVRGWKVTAYDVEMLFLARKMGVGISEVQVKWKDEDTSVDKGRNFVRESLEMFGEILRVRINDLLGKYDNVAR